MGQWLQHYAFRVQVTPWFFIVPSLLLLFIALLTISMHTWQAAQANPVVSLKNE